jgi:Diadenosine tetraphosphate (Ap4A) hydrolase and other HIT family hydrolases
MNETMRKFGWPASVVTELEHWAVLVRPAQPTLGSLVLAARSDAIAFGDLPLAAHAELKEATGAIEAALQLFTGYEKLNYLMLMMVDPHVHFHVIPRYEGRREWSGLTFADAGWPAVPALSAATPLNDPQIAAMVEQLRAVWR